MKGSGAAGVATIGAAGVEVAQDVLAETRSAIQPLIPHLDTLRWLFIAAALIGIGMLARAAEQGARRALANVGLEGPEAAIDIHDLRTLPESLRMARRTAWQTIIRLMTTGLLLALIAGIAVKLKLFG